MKLGKNLCFSLVILCLSASLAAMQSETKEESKSSKQSSEETPAQPAPEKRPEMIHWRKASFPSHWGAVPDIQTQDIRQLPKPYEKYYGSSTLYGWIEENQQKDLAGKGKDQSSDKPKCGVYPKHWGNPPKRQTRDLRWFPAPWDHCRGSGTVVRWIKEKQAEDKKNNS